MLKKPLEALGSEIITEIVSLSSNIISVACIGVIGYILYHCIIIMFFGKQSAVQKVIFGYFGLLLLRILNVAITIRKG